MRRAAWMLLVALAACKGPPPTPTKASLAEGHAEVAKLRAAAEAWTRERHRCPSVAELLRADATLRAKDPWGHAYVLLCPGQNGHAADAVSPGPDGELATEDDLRSWDAR